MIRYHKTHNKHVENLPAFEADAWVDIVAPGPAELLEVEQDHKVPMEFLTAALDPDERARFEYDPDEEVLLLLVRIPLPNETEVGRETEDVPYITRPLGIMITENSFITICNRENTVMNDFKAGKVKHFSTDDPTRFVLQILNRATETYLSFLKDIDTNTYRIEEELSQTLRNKELLQLLNQKKSLVYFTTSLRTNQIMMDRLRKSQHFRITEEEDQELIEDILIDNSQAIEMANVYTNIIGDLMDSFYSVISNNLNEVMSSLTKVTIILMLPTLVASIYGMNVDLPLDDSPNAVWYVLGLGLVSALLGFLIFNYRRRG